MKFKSEPDVRKKCKCNCPTECIDEDHLEKYPYFKEVCVNCGGKLQRDDGWIVIKRGQLTTMRFSDGW